MSIARIAEAANVSYATAWRIINNRPCSSEQAVKAVHRAVRQIGYETAPGPRRRGRPTKVIDGIRTRNVALLHLRPGTSLSSQILSAVQGMLAERDLNLVFAQVEDAAALPQAVRAGNVDGILGYGKFPDAAITPTIEHVPAVWMMSRNDHKLDRFGDRVAPDHRAIGQLAAQHLLEFGAKRVAILNPFPQADIYRQRCDALAESLADGNVVIDRYDGGGSAELNQEVADVCDRWLATSPDRRATAMFVPADGVALPIQRKLLSAGVRFANSLDSGGLHLVSSDNDAELIRQMTPPPVTIDLCHEAIAQQAVERLLWRMRHGTSVPQTTLYVRPRLVLPGQADPKPLAALLSDL